MPARRTSYSPSYTSRTTARGSRHGRGGYSAPPPPQRRSVSVLLVLLAAMVGLAVFGWLQSRNAALPGGARLVALAGQATVERADSLVPPLSAGQSAAIQAGDVVRVAADGRALLSLGAEHSIELAGGAHVELLELVRAPFTRAPDARLALYSGAVLARLGVATGDDATVDTLGSPDDFRSDTLPSARRRA